MSCDLTDIRQQLSDLQKISDEYDRYHRDDEPLDEKAIIERTKSACIEAVASVPNNYPQMQALKNAKQMQLDAIKAIREVK